MEIQTFRLGSLDNCVYLVIDGREAIVIDPTYQSTELITATARAVQATIRIIVNTHGHFDHIADNQPLHQATHAQIACHKNDELMLLHPSDQGFDLPYEVLPTIPQRQLWEGNTIVIGSLKFRVLHTPGHTPGSICLYEETKKVLFTGDTLFAGTYGRTDFPGGSPERMQDSLERLARLPPDVVVYPGHGAPTTIGKEQAWIAPEMAQEKDAKKK